MPPSKPKRGADLEEALKPKHLTTKPTPLKNDPSDIPSALKIGMHGLAFAKAQQNAKLDQSSYLDLIEIEYNRLVTVSKPFAKKVSLTMYTIYATTLLYRRIFGA